MLFRKAIFFLLLFLFIPFSLHSQKVFREGFIIKDNGNFIEGLVEHSSDKKIPVMCVFKRFEIAEKITFNAGEIKAFGFKNGMRYESLGLNGKSSFAETLVLGELSLFRGEAGYFIRKDGGEAVVLKKGKISVYDGMTTREFNSPVEYLRYLTEGSNINIKNDADPDKDYLPVIISYNQKNNKPYKLYENLKIDKKVHEELNWMATMKRSNYGISAGINLYDLTLTPNYDIYVPEPDYVIKPTFGVYYERIISRRTDKLSIHTGVTWLKHSLYSYTETPTEINYLIRDDAYIDFSAIKVPLFFRYSMGGSRIVPFINGGLTGMYLINKNYLHISESEAPDHDVYTSEDNNMKFRTTELCISLGAGVKIRVRDEIFFVIETRIDGGNGIFNTGFPRGNSFDQHSLQPNILLGIQF